MKLLAQPNVVGTVTGKMYRLFAATFLKDGIEIYVAARSIDELCEWCLENGQRMVEHAKIKEVVLAEAAKFVPKAPRAAEREEKA